MQKLNVCISNQRIRMISEGSCDTEDWSNNWSNVTTKINYILEYIKTENSYFWVVIIFHNITVLALVSIIDLFQNILKIQNN